MTTFFILLVTILNPNGNVGTAAYPYATLNECQAAGDRGDHQVGDGRSRSYWRCSALVVMATGNNTYVKFD